MDEKACRASSTVLFDFRACRVRRVSVNAGKLQSKCVCKAPLPTCVYSKDRMIPAYPVEVVPVHERKGGVLYAPGVDPYSAWESLCPGCNCVKNLFF